MHQIVSQVAPRGSPERRGSVGKVKSFLYTSIDHYEVISSGVLV